MTARERLDAEFIDAAPAPVASPRQLPSLPRAKAGRFSRAARADDTSNAPRRRRTSARTGTRAVPAKNRSRLKIKRRRNRPNHPWSARPTGSGPKFEMTPKTDGQSRSSNRTAGTKTTSTTKDQDRFNRAGDGRKQRRNPQGLDVGLRLLAPGPRGGQDQRPGGRRRGTLPGQPRAEQGHHLHLPARPERKDVPSRPAPTRPGRER